MIPAGRGEIASAKWYGSLRRGRGAFWGLVPLLALSVLSESMGILSGVMLACTAAIFCSTGISFGLWLSVRHDSVAAASGRFLLVFVGWLSISWLVVESLQPPPPTPAAPWLAVPISTIERDETADGIGPVVSPVHLWKSLCLSNSIPTDDDRGWIYGERRTRFETVEQLIPAQVGLILWLFVGVLFYSMALNRLSQDWRF